MITFIVIAGVLTLGLAAWIARPLWQGERAAAVVASVALFGGAAGLYALWSDWNWSEPVESAATPAQMVAKLARRLEREPEDLDGWLMLGRSYAALEQYPLAARAYQRADRLAGSRNAEALTGWAEALTLGDENELAGRAGRLFEQALTLEPDSGKALFFAGIAAERRGELPLARERFVRLLALGPPDNVRPILQQQVAALDAAMAQAAAAGTPPAAAGAADAAARIDLEVSVDPAVQARIPPGAILFVAVRRAGESGPPLAARRLPATFPQGLQLTPADAMMPGRSFAAGEVVEVVARVALGGTPTAQSGDPFGTVRYHVGKDGKMTVRIDRLTP